MFGDLAKSNNKHNKMILIKGKIKRRILREGPPSLLVLSTSPRNKGLSLTNYTFFDT